MPKPTQGRDLPRGEISSGELQPPPQTPQPSSLLGDVGRRALGVPRRGSPERAGLGGPQNAVPGPLPPAPSLVPPRAMSRAGLSAQGSSPEALSSAGYGARDQPAAGARPPATRGRGARGTREAGGQNEHGEGQDERPAGLCRGGKHGWGPGIGVCAPEPI